MPTNDDTTTLGIGDTVYVINKESNPRTEMFSGRRYVLNPNEKIPVPWEAAVLWYGDPRSSENIASLRDPLTDATSFIPDRESEVRRLVVRYGGDEHARFPDVEILDLDGNNLYSVIEDPEGSHVMPARATVDEVAEKDRKISTLESRLARLEGLLTGNPDQPGDVKGQDADDDVSDPDEVVDVGKQAEGGDASAADVPEADEAPATPSKGKGRPIR